MRIAFDYQAFVRQSYGGISRYFTCLATGLLELNQEVQIFAPLHRNNYLSVLPRHVVNGRQLNRYPAYTAWLILAYNDLVANSAITKWTPDLVHETFYSMRRSTSRQCPTVITAYDMIPELFPDECSIADNAGQIKRIAIERADHVICISENTKSDLMRLYGTSPDKLSVVHLGFDQFATTRGLAQIATRHYAGAAF